MFQNIYFINCVVDINRPVPTSRLMMKFVVPMLAMCGVCGEAVLMEKSKSKSSVETAILESESNGAAVGSMPFERTTLLHSRHF